MNTDAIAAQYRAALSMLKTAIETCTDDLWDASVGRHPFWLIAYHTLYYTDLYLSGSVENFNRPEFARENEQYMSHLPWPPNEAIEIGEPYSREDLLSFETRCQQSIQKVLPAETEASLAAKADFEWIEFSRFELHLYNIRHIQHHVAQLSLELKFQTGTGIDWVGIAN